MAAVSRTSALAVCATRDAMLSTSTTATGCTISANNVGHTSRWGENHHHPVMLMGQLFYVDLYVMYAMYTQDTYMCSVHVLAI